MEVTRALARNIVEKRFEDLPGEIVEVTKRSILDTFGVMLPPTTLERACIALEGVFREEGESTLIGFGGRASPLSAAFLNGSLCHPMDYDDTVDEAPTHPSGSAIPSALAIAEKLGTSGKDFITAIALANDLNVRLSLTPKGRVIEDYPWFPITTFGVFSATASAGKILSLSEDEMINALGIAVERVFGLISTLTSPDSEIRAIRDGFTNREGLTCALMAKAGIRATREGIEKLFDIFYRGEWEPGDVLRDLGERYLGDMVSFKAWPSCRGTHAFIQAALDMAKEINTVDIEEILLRVGKFGALLCTPEEERKRPRISIGAKFSLPFCIGVALLRKKVVISDFLPENLGDEDVLRIADKVRYELVPEFGSIVPAEVEISLKGGRKISRRVEVVYGHPRNPMRDEDLIAKFKDCAKYSKRPLSEKDVEEIIDKILHLEDVKDIRELTKHFA